MNSPKKILVAPLDWGLGHAARCTPLIKKLLEKGVDVLLGGSGISGKLLQMEFPHVRYFEIPGYEVSYSTRVPMAITMLRQAPGILKSFQQEKKWLEDFISIEKIDAVISDHRYGLYSKKTYSIFLGHQLFITSGDDKVLDPLLWKVNKSYIENFDMCWIPDLPGEPNASGKLSHKAKIPFKHSFIGLLSRLLPPSVSSPKKYACAFILSGPEPLRTDLENLIIDQLHALETGTFVLVRGTQQNIQRTAPANLEIIDMATSQQSSDIVALSEIVVSRAGYSSIMDYLVTSTTALLIPTPGQTEQVYLAKYHLENNQFYSVEQDQLFLYRDLKLAATFKPTFINNVNLLEIAVDELINRLN